MSLLFSMVKNDKTLTFLSFVNCISGSGVAESLRNCSKNGMNGAASRLAEGPWLFRDPPSNFHYRLLGLVLSTNLISANIL